MWVSGLQFRNLVNIWNKYWEWKPKYYESEIRSVGGGLYKIGAHQSHILSQMVSLTISIKLIWNDRKSTGTNHNQTFTKHLLT